MDLDGLSISDLKLFEAMFRFQNVTQAARHLGLPQSTASRVLSQLRSLFGDDLFVRTGDGMKPTPAAQKLSATVSEVLRLIDSSSESVQSFDPVKHERRFVIAGSDVAQLVSLTHFRSIIKVETRVTLECLTVAGKDLAQNLAEGHADLAIGGYPLLQGGIKTQALYNESYQCFCRPTNGFASDPTLERFLLSNHCMVSTKGLAHVHRDVEQLLSTIIPSERMKVISSSFLVAMISAQKQDLIVTAPSQILKDLAQTIGLVSLPPPIEIPDFSVKQYWHARYTNDPAHQWLRKSIYEDMRRSWQLED